MTSNSNNNLFFTATEGDIISEVLAVTPQEYTEPVIRKNDSYEFLDQVMNDHEKQLYTVMMRYSELRNEKIDIINKGDILVKDVERMKDEIEVLSDKYRMLKNLLWFSIQNRLDIWGQELGLYPGFRIGKPEEQDCDCPVCSGILNYIVDEIAMNRDKRSMH